MAGGIIRLDQGWRLDQGHRFDMAPNANPPPAPPPPVIKKEKGKHMDFIPDKRADLYLWCKNMSENAVAETAKFGAPAGDGTAMKTLAEGIIAAIDGTNQAQTAVDGARVIERTTLTANLAQIRTKVRNWKTLTGFPTSGSEAVLKLKGGALGFDPNTYKPEIKATVEAGQVKFVFKKTGVDGLNFYLRRNGVATKVGYDTNTPYYDTTPLLTAGVPEVRDYFARGVIDDVEIGLESDIVRVTFAG